MTRRTVLVVMALALVPACGATPLEAPGSRALESSRREEIERELTSGTWTSGYSGDAVGSQERLHFMAPDRVEHVRSLSGSAAIPDPEMGTYRVTEAGTVEQVYAGRTLRSTFVSAEDELGRRVWTQLGFVGTSANPRAYWHELGSLDGTLSGSEVRAELVFEEPVETLTPGGPCRARLRVEASTSTDSRETEHASLDLTMECRVQVQEGRTLVSFAGLPIPSRPIEVGTDWTNWVSTNGHRTWSGAMEDLMGSAFASVLVFDPEVRALYGLYVSGPRLEP